MATHKLSILGTGARPDTSGKCWAEPYTILATNDAWGQDIFRFDDDGTNADVTTRVGLRGSFRVPDNYVSGVDIIARWSSTATAANTVQFDFDYRAVAVGESMDQTGVQEALTSQGTDSATANILISTTIGAATDGNFTAGDIVEFEFFVDGATSHTMTVALILHDLIFQYADA